MAMKGSAPETPPVSNAPLPRYHFHWHVFLTHFPLSFFGVAFGFQVLHLFVFPFCFELATNVSLIAGTLFLIPTTMTGWRTWKGMYRGAKGLIFRRKIAISLAMLALSVPLTLWRTVYLNAFVNATVSPWHWIYFAGNTLLILGAIGEGFYGSRLNHR
jgi:hypothetical protein